MRKLASFPFAPPTANETIVLFTTAPRHPGGDANKPVVSPTALKYPDVYGRSVENFSAIELTFLKHNQASAANGLRLYTSLDGGNSWIECGLIDAAGAYHIGSAAAIQVPALNGTTVKEAHYVLDVSRYEDFCVELTAGGTTPTEWAGLTILRYDESVITR